MFNKSRLWIYCIVGFIVYSINELLIYKFINNTKQILSIHLVEGFFSILIIGLLLSHIFTKRNQYTTSRIEGEERLHTLINAMVDVVIFKDGRRTIY